MTNNSPYKQHSLQQVGGSVIPSRRNSLEREGERKLGEEEIVSSNTCSEKDGSVCHCFLYSCQHLLSRSTHSVNRNYEDYEKTLKLRRNKLFIILERARSLLQLG